MIRDFTNNAPIPDFYSWTLPRGLAPQWAQTRAVRSEDHSGISLISARGQGTTGSGATSPLPCDPEKVPSRSDLSTFVKSIAARRFVEFTTYALASRLIASWMEARVTKVTKVSARFSEVLGEAPTNHAIRRDATTFWFKL
jgi:hypothetical protein